jgi:hypothetical protein
MALLADFVVERKNRGGAPGSKQFFASKVAISFIASYLAQFG